MDFGTASVRVSIFDSERGLLGAGVVAYPVLRSAADPDFATQRHEDHLKSLEAAFAETLIGASVAGQAVAALAVATTGSSVVMIDEKLQPLGDYYLWCDHRAWREAAEITQAARAQGLPALDFCGGAYSAEWGWAKVLHWLRRNPSLRSRFATGVEHCDLVAATLCGIADIDALPRSACAAGHKWMWNAALGGPPTAAFLESVDPLLGPARRGYTGRFATSDAIAGYLSNAWAARLGLRAGIPVPVGALDAHWDAVGAGCGLGDIVNVIGTSTCIMALSEGGVPIPGVSGVAQGSIHPGYAGIEAGLSAAGDVFEAIANRAGTKVAVLAEAVREYRAGQTGLMRIPWDNGDRSILVDPTLRGVTMGWRLGSTAADELFAAIEGTGFQTRIILDRMAAHGAIAKRVINAGGIPRRNSTLNRVYANILGRPILVPGFDGAGQGSAIFAFLACGAFQTIEAAQAALSKDYKVFEPDWSEAARYQNLYGQFVHYYELLSREAHRFDA